MWMVHDIFHAMFEIKERRFCWGVHIATDAHGDILKNVASLDSDVHESTNPVIEGSSIRLLNLFHILSNERCINKKNLFK